MRVPVNLIKDIDSDFEKLVGQFLLDEKYFTSEKDLHSTRFLTRSVVPHIQKLSRQFNRLEEDGRKSKTQSGLDPYWKKSSNLKNLRLAYFLYFMPANLFRMASVCAELESLGYRWPERESLRGVEFGAGPASGVCGVGLAQKHLKIFPETADWALIEHNKGALEMGEQWARTYLDHLDLPAWSITGFHQAISETESFLPRKAPRFNLWLMSTFMNEFKSEPAQWVETFLRTASRHLENEGLVILIEPALKDQSRRLLEFRKVLLETPKKHNPFQILTPCLGHQACGALAAKDDWCHEEVSWWRPKYYRMLDDIAGLNRKSLAFSYLILAKSKRPIEEILPKLSPHRMRLVSPAFRQGPDLEFLSCSELGKKKTRMRIPKTTVEEKRDLRAQGEKVQEALQRGDILQNPKIDSESTASYIRITDSP